MDSLQDINSFDDLYDIDLMCPYCHDVVEIFNNDLKFSIDIHSQNDVHKTAYKMFQENNISQTDKPSNVVSETLDHRQNKFILDSILKSLSKEVAPVNLVAFEDDQNSRILDSQNNLPNYASKLDLKDSSQDLNKLFMRLLKGYEYNIPYISNVGNKLCCKLCSCDISMDGNENKLLSNLKIHLEGSHQLQYIKEMCKLFPKTQIEDEYYFKLIPGYIVCKLCNIKIPVALSGLESTFYNVLIHVKGMKHEVNSIKHVQDYEGLKQIFNFQLPKVIESNKFYLIKDGNNYKCIVCNQVLPISEPIIPQTLLRITEHLNSTSHKTKRANIHSIYKGKPGSSGNRISDYEYLKLKIHPHKSEIIEQNRKYITKNHDHFICTLCYAHLLVSLEPSITISTFSQHFKGLNHKKNLKLLAEKQHNQSNKTGGIDNQPHSTNMPPNKSVDNNDFVFLKAVLNEHPSPNFFEQNKQFIIKQGDHFHCMLCEAQLDQVLSDVSKTFYSFSKHLESKCHVQKMIDLADSKKEQTCTPPGTLHKSAHKPSNAATCNDNSSYLKAMLDPYPVPQIIEQNSQFITKQGDHFKCVLCAVEFTILFHPANNILQLYQHFHDGYHQQNKIAHDKNLANKPNFTMSHENKTDSSYDNVSSIPLLNDEQNLFYLIKQGQHFKCVLCDSQILFSYDFSKTIFQCKIHKLNKITSAKNTVEQFTYSAENISQSSNVNISSETLLNKVIYFLNLRPVLAPEFIPQIFKQNKQFLINQGNVIKCILCNVQLTVSSDHSKTIFQFTQHLQSMIHKQNDFFLAKNVEQFTKTAENRSQSSNVNMPSVPLLNNEMDSSSDSLRDFSYLKAILKTNGIPPIIEQNAQFLIKQEDNFKCILCNVQLMVLSDPLKTVLQFIQHLESNTHKHTKITCSKIGEQSINPAENRTLSSNVNVSSVPLLNIKKDSSRDPSLSLKEILNPYSIPQIILENEPFLIKQGDHFKCMLCNAQLMLSSDPPKTIFWFTQHLDSKIHKHKKMAFSKISEQSIKPAENKTRSNTNVPSNPLLNNEIDSSNNSLQDFSSLKEILKPYPIPQVIEQNKRFIIKQDDHFKCIMCDVQLTVSSDPPKTIFQFTQHLQSKIHKKNKISHAITVKTVEQSTKTAENISQSRSLKMPSNPLLKNEMGFMSLKAILSPLPIPQIIEQNKDYIIKFKEHFKCVLCDRILQLSKSMVNFVSHFESANHKRKQNIHTKTMENKTAQLDGNLAQPTTSNPSLHKKVANIIYPNDDTDIFVKCHKCDVPISVSSDSSVAGCQVSQHLQGKNHKKKERALSMKQNVQVNSKENPIQPKSNNMISNSSLGNNKTDIMSLKAILSPYPLPQIFEQNKDYIIQERDHFKCVLCNVQLEISPDASKTVSQFSLHLNGTNHKRLHKNRTAKIDDDLTKSTPVIKTSVDDIEAFMQLKVILHPYLIPEIFEQNRDHLIKEGKHLKCILCNVQIVMSSDASKIVFEFSKHLNSAQHKKKQQKALTMKIEKQFVNSNLLSKTGFEHFKDTIHPYTIPHIIEENKKYIAKSGAYFECTLCVVQFKITSHIFNMIVFFSEHFNCIEHVKKVESQKVKGKTAISNEKLSIPSISSNNHLTEYTDKDAIMNLIETLQLNTTPEIFIENKEYIVKSGEHYLCSLCNARLSVSPNASSTITQFSQHLCSPRHIGKVRAFKDKLQTTGSNGTFTTPSKSVKNPLGHIYNNTQQTTTKQEEVYKSLKNILYPYNIPHVINTHMAYIRKIKDHYLCAVCNVQLCVTSKPYITILNFVQHLGSYNHISKVKSIKDQTK